MADRAEVVIVLAKQPRAGRVKTRLHARFTAPQAASLAAAAIRDTLAAVRGSGAQRRILCWEGDPAGFENGFEVIAQRKGGLERRLAGAFTDAAAAAGTRMLLIGMDTPQVVPALLDANWDGCQAVLGLSDDGGFWAIGLRSGDPSAVFAGIEMSTRRTGSAQLARLVGLGCSVKLLPPLCDVDTPEDAEQVADQFPRLEFARAYAALQDAEPEADHLFDRLYRGESVRAAAAGEHALRLEPTRWAGPADGVDRLVVSRCRGPVLDLGCGPGRMVEALNEAGVPALGVDMSAAAVAATRARGGLAVRARLADRLPAEGRWGTVLLMDGNIGIGGDIATLLHRCRELLVPGGGIVVELDPDPDCLATGQVQLTAVGSGHSAGLAWARAGAAALKELAGPLDLLLTEEWSAGGRSFLTLQAAA